MQWDAATYEAFSAPRREAFEHLLAALPEAAPRLVVDAGCGTGATTHALAARFPEARVLGVDASAGMLAQARPSGRIRFVRADLRAVRPPQPADLVVANASLQWIARPEQTLRHLVSWLAPGGVLAVQVPANHDAPSHRLARQVAAAMGLEVAWGDHVLDGPAMRAALEAAGCEARVWDHVFEHDLAGEDAVLRWLEGTTLRPVMDAAGDRYDAYRERLAALLGTAYPAVGAITRFPFRRRFAVAVRGNGPPPIQPPGRTGPAGTLHSGPGTGPV